MQMIIMIIIPIIIIIIIIIIRLAAAAASYIIYISIFYIPVYITPLASHRSFSLLWLLLL